jgi:transposase
LELSNDIEVLGRLVTSLLTKVEELTAENTALRAENAELRQRLNQNSQNSSLPPSQDTFKSKPALAKKAGNKPGGQTGHSGKTLQMSTAADHIELLLPADVCACGADLRQVEASLKERRQVFDLPQPKLAITEYRQYQRQCPCCQAQLVGAFPDSVTNHVQYGAGVLALCSLLNNSFHLSCSHISQLFEDLYHQPLNEATVLKANQVAYQSLQESEKAIKQALLDSPLVHFDETGLACGGQTHWLHTASTHRYTYLFVHAKRGLKALQSEASLLKDFQNFSLHDCWASYFCFTATTHTLCNAHLVRELQALIEVGSQWATQMQALLLELYQQTNKGQASLADSLPYSKRYESICASAQQEEPPPNQSGRGKPKSSKGRNLLKRLIDHQQAVLAFTKYDFVPFTNNQAERDIRPVKGKIKTAGCFPTQTGAQHYARIQAFISTARKQGKAAFNELKNSLAGFNFIVTDLNPAK